MSDFVAILLLFSSILASFFIALDSVYLGDMSLLMWLVAIEFFHISLWFIMSLINPYFKGDPHDVSGSVTRGVSQRARSVGSRLSSYRSNVKKGGKVTRIDGHNRGR